MATDRAAVRSRVPACAAVVFAGVFGLTAQPSGPGQADTTAPAQSPAADGSARIPVLDTMLITDTPVRFADAAAASTIVDGDAVRFTPRATPLEALAQESADIYVTSRGAGVHGVASGASGGIAIRGLGGSPNTQVLVVEDGAPDYQGIFGHPIPDAFSPALIERVEVVKGGDAVRYGTNAMAGVVVIENRWPSADGWRLENDAAWGNYQTLRERLVLMGRTGRLETVGAFSVLTTDGHRTGAEGALAAGQLGLRLRLSDTWRLSVRDKLVHLEGGDPGPAIAPYTDHWFDVRRNNLVVRAEGALGRGSADIKVWYNAGVHKLYDGFRSADHTLGSDCVYHYGWRNTLQILAGVAAEHVAGDVENRISGGQETVPSASAGALYGQCSLTPGLGIEAVAGGRLHYSTRYGLAPLYKAGLRWAVAPGLALHTRIARNFRQPTLRELYLPYPTANPDLQPEYSRQWDAGVEVQVGPFSASSDVYITEAENMIRYFGVWPSAEVVNIDHTRTRGIEATVELGLMWPIRARLSGCWQDVGRYTKQNPEAKANAVLEWRHETKLCSWTATLTAEWVHGLYMANYREEPIDDVFFADGAVHVRFALRPGVALTPYLVVRNIFNNDCAYVRYYPMPSLHALCGLRLEV